MTHILHRQIGGTLPVAVGGRGIEIIDAHGQALPRRLAAAPPCPASATAIRT